MAGQQAGGPVTALGDVLASSIVCLVFALSSTQVLCVRRFEEESEAVEAANSSDFGLAAAVMSSDEER